MAWKKWLIAINLDKSAPQIENPHDTVDERNPAPVDMCKNPAGEWIPDFLHQQDVIIFGLERPQNSPTVGPGFICQASR